MRNKVVMIYPHNGIIDNLVRHIPLSLLHASSLMVKMGISVCVIDIRLCRHNWKNELCKVLDKDTLLVGISVMSGEPIKSAINISSFIKKIDPEIFTVWGHILGDNLPLCYYILIT
ncbi:MAG: hypothetical protein HQK53_10335 [Oligoflexia bacterium]|nr:hypothetical protein [Oligoflexia bacterium]